MAPCGVMLVYIEPLTSAYQRILFDHRGHGQSDRPRDSEAHHTEVIEQLDDVIDVTRRQGTLVLQSRNPDRVRLPRFIVG
jgi:pimeloyl-ACP methyl ester carboxylesterase